MGTVRGTSYDTGAAALSAKHKLWLEKNGAIFGEGLFNILIKVKDTGSISQAAREMSMSYRAAWGKIKVAEKHWGVPLLVTQVGGEMGGGAKLTPGAEELLRRYREFQREVDSFIQNSFEQIFQG
ncbi:winged helix-turn-helix domain-containing protein [Pelotomaculum propionicicum]|uniref:Molybdenum-pterin-binding protein MopB n=1 Tax=Pelotomaculum propionicicum TaxID=258475 RepID=A0A4Y7RX60_9FIRM|nr:LysR family transcriptional regulator [Pelotomaculum propionicicum]NLI14129.1 LysR family transcriptional regulator [Peptococcaceae bacterium]TEB13433.1 Molybdenum-pterin-binding protein MopB [Pelotomaculum propionicicum]